MSNKQNRNPHRVRMFSPRGLLKFPKLTEIDYGTDKFPTPDGEYNAVLVMKRGDKGVDAFLRKLDDMAEIAKTEAEAQIKKMKVADRKQLEARGGAFLNPPYKEVYDEDTEEPTGEVEFKAKMKASGVRKRDGRKWSMKPDLFDSFGKPLPKGVSVWGGSEAILNFDADVYYIAGSGAYGVSARLNAAQIVELVTAGGQRSASSYGFEDQGEGFSVGDIQQDDDEDEGDYDADDHDDDEDDDPDF